MAAEPKTIKENRMQACFICKNILRIVFSGNGHDVVRCGSCGVMYVNPLPELSSARLMYENDPIIHFSHGREKVLHTFFGYCREDLGATRALVRRWLWRGNLYGVGERSRMGC